MLFRRLLLAAKAFSLLIFLEKDFIDHFRHDAEQEDAEGFFEFICRQAVREFDAERRGQHGGDGEKHGENGQCPYGDFL